MRIYWIALLSCLSGNLATAQVESYKKGDHVKQPVLDKFEGSYKWEGKEGMLKMTLRKDTNFFKGPDLYIEGIVGSIVYNRDGQSYKVTSTRPGKPAILGYARSDSTIVLIFYDKRKSKSVHAILTLTPAGTAIWKLTEPEGLRIKGDRKKGFTYPENIVLIRTSRD